MAYFYSEKGMRFFVLLLALLLGWFFMGVGRAALADNARLPEEAGRIAKSLCHHQIPEIEAKSALVLIKAFAQ